MKKLLTILILFAGLPALSQTYKIGEITQLWTPKHVYVTDGLVHKYTTYDGYDTAYRYIIAPNPDTFDVVVTFKKRLPPAKPDVVTIIDDYPTAPQQTYLPATRLADNVASPTAWAHMKNNTWNANHYANTVSFVEPTTAGTYYVELTCVCYKVEWWGERRNNHGIASITTDGGSAVNVDTYGTNSDNPSTLLWTSPATITTNGTRKFRVTYTGTKNPASSGASIVHDKWIIYTKQP